MSEKGFDASRYLVKLRGKDYLEVRWRLLWLRTEHPDAVIETELVSHSQNPPGAIFKARVSIPGTGSATGYKQALAADFGDYLEKAETGALGRALAALGYGTQFTEDFDFSDGGEQRAGRRSGRRLPAAGGAPAAPGVPAPEPLDLDTLAATEQQRRALQNIAQENGWDEEEMATACIKRWEVLPDALSRRQAGEWIRELQAEKRRGRAAR